MGGIVRVVTRPALTRWASLEDVQAELNTASPRLDKLLDQASAACVAFLGRPIARASYSEVFDGARSRVMLSRVPIALVQSVVDDLGLDLINQWVLDPNTGQLTERFRDWFSERSHRVSSVTVHYDGGYLMPGDPGCDLPDDYQRACIEQVKAFWFSGGDSARDPTITSDSADGIGRTTYAPAMVGAAGLTQAALDLLQPHRPTRT